MRNLFFSMAIFLLPTAAGAQTFGLKAGITRNKFYGSQFYDVSHRPLLGFSAGFTVSMPLPADLSIRSGLQFDRIGSRINNLVFSDPAGNFATGNWNQQLNYITLPVLLQFALGPKKAFSLGGGFFAGYLVSAKNRFVLQSGPRFLPERTESKSNYHNFNFGVAGNASYRVPLNNKLAVILGFEDYLGMKNLGSGPNAPERMRSNSLGGFVTLEF